MKKTVIHFIYDLGRGGAETMLVRVIKELKEYHNIVVTLKEENHFGLELQCDQLICLNMKSVVAVPEAVIQLRKIIKKQRPAFVHSHLIWPTMIARIATPRHIPLITTIHTSVATSLDYKRWYIKLLDKLTYRWRRSVIIVVAKAAHEQYFSILKLKPYRSHVLHTFVDTRQFRLGTVRSKSSDLFKVIAVGALSVQKNFAYLVHAFARLKEENMELHIYGKGDRQLQLQQLIAQTGARVILKGQVNNIQEIIPEYDLYVMASLFEGFSLSVLEAMAIGKPLLLSDIPSFREQCGDCARYFDLNNPDDFTDKLKDCRNHKESLQQMSVQGYQRVINNFTLAHHMAGLRKIYSETIKDYQ